jgi:transcriptional regulator with XRE-family HTH domain
MIIPWAPEVSTKPGEIIVTRTPFSAATVSLSTSTPYVGHLESGKRRRPSERIVTRLAEALGLDRQELFFLADPRPNLILDPQQMTA